MELTSSSHTSLACFITSLAYTLGEIFITLFAWIARDWLLLKWMISIYFAICLPYAYFVPESPYWLLSQKKYAELEKFLREIAKVNGGDEEDWMPLFNQLMENTRLTETIEKKQPSPEKRSNKLRYLPRLAIGGFIEFVVMLLYTKISYSLGMNNGAVSPYLNMIVGAFVEAVGYLIASVLITTALGRKYSLILFSSLTSICVLVIPLFMKTDPFLTAIISQLGKLTVSSAFGVSWIYVPELFPTDMRGLANAVFVSVGSLGSILAPIVDESLGDDFIYLSFYAYSTLIVILVLLVSPLPETRNRSFDGPDE